MPPLDTPPLRLGRLLASWPSLTGWLVWACAARVKQGVDCAGDAVKDAILDLGCPAPEPPGTPPAPLPPVDPERLSAALRGPIEEALRRAAEVINEEPDACPGP